MSRSKNRNTQDTSTHLDIKPEEESSEMDANRDVSIGGLLRNEREKRGLTYSELSEMTCIRSYILKAIENEDWANLPSPVFVKGFIRSYAGALGLEEGELLSLYQEAFPIKPPAPKPLVEPARSKKAFYVLFVFLLFAMAVAYYIWKEYPDRKEVLIGADTISPTNNEIVKQNIPRDLLDDKDSLLPEDKEGVHSVTKDDIKARDWEGQDGKEEDEKEINPSTPQPGLNTLEEEEPEVTVEKENTLPAQTDLKTKKPQARDLSTESDYELTSLIEDLPLTLTAHVRKKTWIKIYLDDGSPKEYIFDPGDHHEWKARKGFDITIGNAGGIDLEFNGEKIENLGATGQVVHMVFPQFYLERSQN